LQWEKSKSADVTGYIIRYGNKPNSYNNYQFVGKYTSAEVTGLKPGIWFFTVSAHKPAYVECWILSNEVKITLK